MADTTKARSSWALNPTKVQQTVNNAYDSLSEERATRKSHLEYYTGRWYRNKSRGTRRPLGLLAQAINAHLGSLVPSDPILDLEPRRLGLGFEAQVLKIQLDGKFADMHAARDVYSPAVADAMVSPLSVTYVGRDLGDQSMHYEGADVDLGDSYLAHIPFTDWCFDQGVKDLRRRRWEAHFYTDSRERMCSVQAYAKWWDVIAKMPSAKESGAATDRQRDSDDRDEEEDSDQVEMMNVVFYDNGRIREAALPVEGKAAFFRDIDYSEAGPENGPYDHLWFYGVPGEPLPVSPSSLWRDACQGPDDTFRKLLNQIGGSKSLLIGDKADQAALEAARDAGDMAALALTNPAAFKLEKLEFVLTSIMPVLSFMLDATNSATNNPALMRGMADGEAARTARGMSILQGNKAQQVGSLFTNVMDLMSRHGQKLGHWELTDPLAETVVQKQHNGRAISLYLTPDTRTAKPNDFRYKILPRAMQNQDPETRTARLVELFQVIIQLMPLFAQGLLQPLPTIRVLQREYGVAYLDQILGMPEAIAERQAAEQAADMSDSQRMQIANAQQQVRSRGTIASPAFGSRPRAASPMVG